MWLDNFLYAYVYAQVVWIYPKAGVRNLAQYMMHNKLNQSKSFISFLSWKFKDWLINFLTLYALCVVQKKRRSVLRVLLRKLVAPAIAHRTKSLGREPSAAEVARTRDSAKRSERRRAWTVRGAVRGQCSGWASERSVATLGLWILPIFASAVKPEKRPTLAAWKRCFVSDAPSTPLSLFLSRRREFVSRSDLSSFLSRILSLSLSLPPLPAERSESPRVRLFPVAIRSIIVYSRTTTITTRGRWRPSRHSDVFAFDRPRVACAPPVACCVTAFYSSPPPLAEYRGCIGISRPSRVPSFV